MWGTYYYLFLFWGYLAIPAGNITTSDRLRRLQDIRELTEQGKNVYEIAKETGMTFQTVQRNIKYLDELSTCDINASTLSAKRGEIYMEALEASREARDQFEKYKLMDKSAIARTWFISWLDSLKIRMTLFGLDSVKIGAFTQINQQYNAVEPEKIDSDSGRKLAEMLKRSHEDKLIQKVESEKIQ